jgi:AraC family transcriptional regulator, regulatory protein of adaptative response / methylphosphotriester-DNA alkyltransferase methyltransferase
VSYVTPARHNAGVSLVTAARRRPTTEATRVALFREAAAVLQAEPARQVTLDALAESLNASPRQLRRAFAEAGGTTFGAFVREIRIARAAELLEQTRLPVHEIAEGVGYSEPGQFTKAFRRSFGSTPTAYRRQAGR